MDLMYGLILAFLLVVGVFQRVISAILRHHRQAGIFLSDVLIQNIGIVTGQGIILSGVRRGTIDTISSTFGLAPVVKTVDLNNMIIVYTDAVRIESFLPVEGYRGIVDTIHEAGAPTMRMYFEEQFVIRINPRAAVVPNRVVIVSVKPAAGRPLVLRRYAPSTITGGDTPLLVP